MLAGKPLSESVAVAHLGLNQEVKVLVVSQCLGRVALAEEPRIVALLERGASVVCSLRVFCHPLLQLITQVLLAKQKVEV